MLLTCLKSIVIIINIMRSHASISTGASVSVHEPGELFWGEWAGWSGCLYDCSLSEEYGVESRERKCMKELGGGETKWVAKCNRNAFYEMGPTPAEYSLCRDAGASSNCKRQRGKQPGDELYGMGGWGLWGPWLCDNDCVMGTELAYRRRQCDSPRAQPGFHCDTSVLGSRQYDYCVGKCASEWSEWTPWGRCACGQRLKERTRVCKLENAVGRKCEGESRQIFHCLNEGLCLPGRKLDGLWGPWTGWSECARVEFCDAPIRNRTRICNNPSPKHGGKNCPGEAVFDEVCGRRPLLPDLCGSDGSWSNWGSWLNCTKPCGGGSGIRLRTCTNPPPQSDGRTCPGASHETDLCNSTPCPTLESSEGIRQRIEFNMSPDQSTVVVNTSNHSPGPVRLVCSNIISSVENEVKQHLRIQWTRNGDTMFKKRHHDINSNSRLVKNDIVFNRIEPGDSGVYICYARAEFTRPLALAMYLVQTSDVPTVVENLNENFHLDCNSEGIAEMFAPSYIYWHKNDRLQGNVSGLDATLHHSILIEKITPAWEGHWDCIVFHPATGQQWETVSMRLYIAHEKRIQDRALEFLQHSPSIFINSTLVVIGVGVVLALLWCFYCSSNTVKRSDNAVDKYVEDIEGDSRPSNK